MRKIKATQTYKSNQVQHNSKHGWTLYEVRKNIEMKTKCQLRNFGTDNF